MSYDENNNATISALRNPNNSSAARFSAENLVIPSYVYDENNSNNLIYKITEIGTAAFNKYSSSALAFLGGTLTLSNTITKVGDNSFKSSYIDPKDDDTLGHITTLFLSKNLQEIGKNAFAGMNPDTINLNENPYFSLTDKAT